MVAGVDVNEDQPDEEECAQYCVEFQRVQQEVSKQCAEGDGGKRDAGEVGIGMAMVEEVAGFKARGVEGIDRELAGVEETVCGVEHPDSEEDCGDSGGWKRDVTGAGDKPGPERGDGRSVEREQVPEFEQGVALVDWGPERRRMR
jgi:hypothetical protein